MNGMSDATTFAETDASPAGRRNGKHGENEGGTDLNARVATLEKASGEIREKLVHVATRLEGLEKNVASKADCADLKTTIAEGFTSQAKWFISTALALAVIAFTAARFMR